MNIEKIIRAALGTGIISQADFDKFCELNSSPRPNFSLHQERLIAVFLQAYDYYTISIEGEACSR